MKSPFILFVSLVAAFVMAPATSLGQRVKKSEFTSAQLNNPSVSKITWTTTTINSRFEPQKGDDLKTQKIVARYKPEVDKYSDPIGYCPTGLVRGYPVAPMSSWAADAFLEYAQNYIDTTSRTDIDKSIKIDFALMNFGGIRTEMPKGNVSRYDILSIFPFDNFLVIEQMNGKDVKELMEFFARTRAQAMSNVKLHIDGNTVKECLIGGKPLDENRNYVIATIDFLYNGGDNLYPLKRSSYLIETHKKLMDIFIEYILDLTAKGKKIEKAKDNRVIVENKEK